MTLNLNPSTKWRRLIYYVKHGSANEKVICKNSLNILNDQAVRLQDFMFVSRIKLMMTKEV